MRIATRIHYIYIYNFKKFESKFFILILKIIIGILCLNI